MSIKPICIFCKKELNNFGAILVSPPDEFDKVRDKIHVCQKCYIRMSGFLSKPSVGGNMNKCSCGFKFAGAGEFRNCEAFITDKGKGGIICPKCGKAHVDGIEVKLDSMEK